MVGGLGWQGHSICMYSHIINYIISLFYFLLLLMFSLQREFFCCYFTNQLGAKKMLNPNFKDKSTRLFHLSGFLYYKKGLVFTKSLLYPPPHCSLRFSLKTRWTTKSDQRTVFTDSLHLYVCGLASPHCTPALVQLARTSGGTGQSWVQKRQALVLKLLKKLCHSNTLTGPKVDYELK